MQQWSFDGLSYFYGILTCIGVFLIFIVGYSMGRPCEEEDETPK